MGEEQDKFELPTVVEEYLKLLTRRIRNKRVRGDVLKEIRGHFEEALADVEGEVREGAAKELIEAFGDAETLSQLIRRAKKRCRPMWVKFTIRSLQTLAALIILFIGYGVSFWMDKPNPTVDYVAELNEMVRPKVDESQNAASYYQKANDLMVQPSEEVIKVLQTVKPYIAMTPEQKRILEKWLEQNMAALDELTQGAGKEHYWYFYKDEETVSARMLDIRNLRMLVRGILWKIWLNNGEDQQTIIQDLRTIYISSRYMQFNSVTIIEQLGGMAIAGLADWNTYVLLEMRKIKPESLSQLANMLDGIYPEGFPYLDFRGEKLVQMDMIQRTFTNGGLGGGHLCPEIYLRYLEKYIMVGENEKEKEKRFRDLLLSNGLYLAHPRREDTIQKMNDYFEILESSKMLSPYEMKISGKKDVDEFIEKNKDNKYLSTFLPGLKRTILVNYRARADFEAIQTVVALMRYREANGRYPDSLESLKPMYLKTLPRDPYGPGTFSYKKVGNDFTLYSLGENLKDDGGVYDWHWGMYAKDKAADYVFWPPEKGK